MDLQEMRHSLRTDFFKELKAICEKYGNIGEDDEEGFLIEDIEKYYNSDDEREGDKTKQQCQQRPHFHQTRIPRRDVPIDVLIKDTKESLNRPNVEHKNIMRTLRLTSRHASSKGDDIDVDMHKTGKVKVRGSKHKRRHHSCHRATPYPIFAMFTPGPFMYPWLPPTHHHDTCYTCR